MHSKFHLCLLVFLSLVVTNAHADVVGVGFSSVANADFDGVFDTKNSTNSTDSISAFATSDNSFSQADLNWTWTPLTGDLAGNSLLTAEKTVSAKPGGEHYVTSAFQFTFQINSNMDINLDGDWGFDNITAGGGGPGEDDSLTVMLTDSVSTIFSDTTTSGTGVTSDSFSYSGTLGPGTYIFSVDATLFEKVNNLGGGNAGWEFNRFNLSNPAAVPEPSSMVLAMFLFVPACTSRRRRVGRWR